MIQSNLEFEREKRDFGMALAADSNEKALAMFRDVAVFIAERQDEPISIADVRAHIGRMGYRYTPGNWLGSLFKTNEWEPVGYTQVTHKGGHARTVRTWRLK